MAQWLEKRENWLPSGKPRKTKPKRSPEKMYSVSEVAAMLSISRSTVFKWLSIDEPDLAVIPPGAWIKLPNGHIRIREWIVLKLQAGEI